MKNYRDNPVHTQIYPSSHKQKTHRYGRVVPLCGAIPQMEGGQWGRGVYLQKVYLHLGIYDNG